MSRPVVGAPGPAAVMGWLVPSVTAIGVMRSMVVHNWFMRTICCALLFVSAAAATHVVGQVKAADGSLFSGVLTLTYNTFIAPDGSVAPRRALQISVQQGVFDQQIFPGPYSLAWGAAPDIVTLLVPSATSAVTLASCMVFPPAPPLQGGVTSFADSEQPGGAVDGVNVVFTLAHAPAGSSLLLARNGVVMSVNFDYALSGLTVTFFAGAKPGAGDRLTAWYRY